MKLSAWTLSPFLGLALAASAGAQTIPNFEPKDLPPEKPVTQTSAGPVQNQTPDQGQGGSAGATAAGAGGNPAPSPNDYKPYRRRSIVHRYPQPDQGQGNNPDNSTPGFRNPGGRGRMGEFYPTGDKFQNQEGVKDPVGVAQFDKGGGPDRQEQMQAQQIGIQRSNSLQNHIDNMARPYYGVGFFGGFN